MARKRFDPNSKPADGYRNYAGLKNADPERHYVYANPNDETCGVDAYEADGYEVERRRPDGPLPAMSRAAKEGEPITVMGQVLMSCPLEQRRQDEAQGQAIVDRVDEVIRKRGNLDGPAEGRGFRVGLASDARQYVEQEAGA